MEDDAQGEAFATMQARYAMTHRPAVPSAGTAPGMLVDGEQRRVALLEWNDLANRLLAWPLLDQHEFATVEVAAGFVQQHRRLQWKDHVAVEIAVQAVVVSGAILQQQRRRSGLPGFVTLL